MGVALVVCSALCLALQNIIIKLLFSRQPVLGFGDWGGWASPSLSHSLLLMEMRMLLMVGLLLAIAPWLYPTTWTELRALWQPECRILLQRTLCTGVLLFLSLAFLYVAISSTTTGIAVTLFFIHPAVTVLLGWLVWGDRPTISRVGVVGIVLVGILFVTPYPGQLSVGTIMLGSGAAIAAGLTFGAHNVVAQSCLRPQNGQAACHPIPFSIVNFLVAIVLSTLCLPLLQVTIAPEQWIIVWIATLLCAIATLAAYVLNFYGIRWLGAATTALIGACNPVLTCLLAWLVIGETFGWVQAAGVVLVAVGVASLSLSQSH